MTQTRSALLALFCTGIAFAGGEGWITDYEAAKKEAAESKKAILIDFTGSDWCVTCVKLSEEVFQQDAFKKFAKEKFVLLELDLPRDKSKQSAKEIAQNKELAEKYVIEGLPTILLTDAEGVPFAATSYEESIGADAYVKQLGELLEKRKTRDDGFAAAAKEEGPAKASALITVLDKLNLHDGLTSNFYATTIAEIKKADPADTTGFSKKMAARERLTKFEDQLDALVDKQNFDGAMKLVEDTLKEGNMSPEDTQRVALMKALIFADQAKYDEAIKALDEAKAIAPASEGAARYGSLKQQLESMKAHGAVKE